MQFDIINFLKASVFALGILSKKGLEVFLLNISKHSPEYLSSTRGIDSEHRVQNWKLSHEEHLVGHSYYDIDNLTSTIYSVVADLTGTTIVYSLIDVIRYTR